MTIQDQKPCGFCTLDGCGPERENCPLKPKKAVKTALNAVGVAVLVFSALAYDTTPIPLWLAAVDLCICVLFMAQVLPDGEVEA